MLKIDAVNTLKAAEEYIDKGWWVLPCLPKSKEPHFGLIKRAHLDATNDLELVKFWLKMDPNLNLGINAIKSGLVILDVDCRNSGLIEPDWDLTYTVKTADGWHLYYKADEEVTYKAVITGVDIKYKGYVVAAPSIHPSGARYEVIEDAKVADLPESVRERICRYRYL